MDHFDIAIVGAGLAGRAAAIVAARSGARVLHMAPEGSRDARTAALMRPAIAFLEEHGLISSPAAIGVPLAEVRIIDMTGRFPPAPEAHFRAAEVGLEAFGWNIANAALADSMAEVALSLNAMETRPLALASAHRANGLWTLTATDGSTATASLLVGADGKGSRVREMAGLAVTRRDYAQSALVCDVELDRPLGKCSVEFHYPNGPFTLVPAGGNRANLVWIDTQDALAPTLEKSEAFDETLTTHALRLFGRIGATTAPRIFPLTHLKVPRAGRDGAVLVGEAAHAFPPIGAQGLNLGLRDIATLADILADVGYSQTDWADMVSESYATRQGPDMSQTGLFVTTLFGTLVGGRPEQQMVRSAGLGALNAMGPLRRVAMAFGMGRR